MRARVIAAVSVIALTLVAAMVFLTRTTESNLTNQVDDELAGAVRPVRALGYGHGDPALQLQPIRRSHLPRTMSAHDSRRSSSASSTATRW
ncbi:MAG: hypothetical protein R2789_02180 [Microthrixaceae bacterium]